MANTVLITGATGKQGGAVIDALLSAPNISDISIFALTRNVESGAAKALVAKAPETIKLVKGDLNDSETIFEAISTPINAVFCVCMPTFGFGAKSESEEIQGKALIDASLKHGVEHFVYTSVDRHGAESDTHPTDIPHFITKFHIEEYLRAKFNGSQLSWTILRPAAFMDNSYPGFAGKLFPTGKWKVGLKPSTKLQIISTADIGWFGAQALLRPKDFAGRAISLAGDELTFDEANKIFQRAVGTDVPVTYDFIGSFLLWAIKDLRTMFKFFENVGFAADISELRKEYPKLQSYEDWAKSTALSTFVQK